jgi:hypothetical protein
VSMPATGRAGATPFTRLTRLCGADIEVGNFVVGAECAGGTSYRASRALLAEISGFPKERGIGIDDRWLKASATPRKGPSLSTEGCVSANRWISDPQDTGRRFLASNGGCAYIDLDHLELCLPEVVCAFDHLAAWHGMLRIARAALKSANDAQCDGERIKVLVNNSDGLGKSSYGSHLSFLIRRRTFENIFRRKPHYLQYLASFQVASLPITGLGKVGSENGRPATRYQISQRADFFEILQGPETTFKRPIVNTRDEALCGYRRGDDPSSPARLHVIFFDSALAHGSALLRVGPMQLILTLLELDAVNAGLILDDPLAALQAYSRDPQLRASAPLINGRRVTAIELECGFLEEVKRYAARGAFDGVVPRADEIIALWENTLVKLARSDLMAVAPRLDWVMKLMAIERAMEQQPRLDWDSPEVKVIDHLYSSLDDGLYWAYEAGGFAEQLVAPESIAYFAANPPANTRAWTRSMLLRRAAREGVVVDSVDWDRITFKIRSRYAWPCYRTLEMADPQGFTEAEARPIFERSEEFTDLLDGLESFSRGRASEPAAAIAD